MTERVIDSVTYAQGWDQENRLVWVSTGGVTTTFTYDANGALVKKEDPLVGTTYYVGPHYEVLVPAVFPPPAPADLTACYESMGGPNVCNDLAWTGSSGVTYNVYRSTTSPVPIDAGHRITSGITETNYTDCGRYKNYYYAVTAVNAEGESNPSNEAQASEPCGSAMAVTLPVLNATALTESGGDPVVTKYFFFGGKRVAMDRDGVVQWLIGDHLGTTSLVLKTDGTVHSEARHYPYGEERWSSGTLPTDYRFTGQRSDSYIKLTVMGARWYDAQLGRWISPDSIIPDPANPQSYNRLSYVYNNPLRFVDPTGHFTEEELIEWGAYTEEELKWLAENQANWYNYLMQAVLGDAFMFARLWAGGVGQFLLDDSDKLFIGGAFWTADSGIQTGGSLQEWGDAVGQAAIQAGIFAPEQRIYPNLPNPHVQLSSQAEETNAEIVLGIDIASTVVSLFGYGIMLVDTLACPMDPAGKAFGYTVTQVGSGIATLSLIDTLVTSGPNSRGFAVSLTTYTAGWSSLPLWAPLDLAAAGSQIAYDIYTLRRIKMRRR